MFFPLKLEVKKQLKNPPWSRVEILSSTVVLLMDNTNLALMDLKNDKVYYNLPQLESFKQHYAAIFLSADKENVLILLYNGQILVWNLKTKNIQIIQDVPTVIQDQYEKPQETTQNDFKLKKLLGIHMKIKHNLKNSNPDDEDCGLKLLDFKSGSLIALMDNLVFIWTGNKWYSYDIFEQVQKRPKGQTAFYDRSNSGFWTTVHYVDNHLLTSQLKEDSMTCEWSSTIIKSDQSTVGRVFQIVANSFTYMAKTNLEGVEAKIQILLQNSIQSRRLDKILTLFHIWEVN
jgi:hypothetical protein